MAKFQKAIDITLMHEGGYVNDPDDPGGETNFGISQRAYPKRDIANLTLKEAEAIYERDYWRFDGVRSQLVANYMFDMAVNHGRTRAVLLTQQTLRRNSENRALLPDGQYGPVTEAAINRVPAGRLLRALRATRIMYYANIVRDRPESAKYLLGWVRRAMA